MCGLAKIAWLRDSLEKFREDEWLVDGRRTHRASFAVSFSINSCKGANSLLSIKLNSYNAILYIKYQE